MKQRCQICGRRTALRANGFVAFHHVAGVPCAGEGALPIEVDDRRLEQAASMAAERGRAASQELAALRKRRANWIPPQLERAADHFETLAAKLTRRLRRNRSWPARFAMQMEKYGYGDPPPPYLVQRQQERLS